MGSLFNSGQSASSTTTQTTTQGQPWQQQNYQNLSNDANGIYNQQSGNTSYNGALYTPINSYQQNAANTLYNGGSSLSGVLSPVLTQGQSGLNEFGNYLSGAGNYANGNFNQGATTAGTAAMNNTSNDLAGYNQGLTGALQMASNPSSQTTSDLNTANQYANNSSLQGLIQSNTQQIANTLNDSTLPSLNAQAIAAGGLNSSRAGAASAIAASQAQQNAQNYASTLENNAYNTGASLGQSAQSTALNGYLGAASTGNAGVYSSLMGQSSNNNQTNANNELSLSGTNLLGNAASMGDGLLSSYGNLAGTAGALQSSGGGILQDNANSLNSANLQQYLMNMQMPWTTLDNLQNIAGQSYGASQTGTSSSKQTSNPSIMQDTGAVLSTLMGALAL